jgi:hypothetical protein
VAECARAGPDGVPALLPRIPPGCAGHQALAGGAASMLHYAVWGDHTHGSGAGAARELDAGLHGLASRYAASVVARVLLPR